MPQAGRPHGERGSQQRRVAVLAHEPREGAGHVDVGRAEHARLHVGPQDRGRGERDAPLARVASGGDHAAPSASRSLSAGTRPSGGRHQKTPHRPSASAGVSAPIIPRRKR